MNIYKAIFAAVLSLNVVSAFAEENDDQGNETEAAVSCEQSGSDTEESAE
ncbi:MAG: hypothetical protein KGZ39_06810 [Simkania sp.]|nr:hypothetical protein [Simkania sp.]